MPTKKIPFHYPQALIDETMFAEELLCAEEKWVDRQLQWNKKKITNKYHVAKK